MGSVSLKNISKSFGNIKVIHGADLEVNEGEFVVFVGPSGCGKSTLLRMIAGLEDISGGELRIGDDLVNDVEPGDRGVSMVFQSYALYPHMDVSKNLSFGLRMKGNDPADTNARVNGAASVLQLSSLLSRLPKQLSGGQRQRVAIGRSIVRKPKVFLFDEPLSNLDAELRVQMRVEIARLHGELGATMIYVTHDQTEAMTLADRIVVLRDGFIEQIGSPLDLYTNPDNQFVAGFIGSPRMNFLKGKALGYAEGLQSVALTNQGGKVVQVSIEHPAGGGSEVTLGLRPEHVEIGNANLDGTFELTTDVVEHLGATSYLYADTKSDEPLIFARQNVHTDRVGDTVRVGVLPDKAILFDSHGKRLR